MKTMVIAALLLVPLAGCTTGGAYQTRMDAREQKELASALDGKVPGRPVSCVSTMRGNNLRAIGDRTLVYKVSNRLVYRNDLEGVCNGLRFGDTLVLRIQGSQYCRGDMASVINLPSGTLTGACALGDFVPYTTPAGG